ncbi:PhzF family phenazine biosynthesis isomerase [Rhodobacterales bacterium HKCCE2091]|nr:PhzF family phenazine biosynthesis isomerase [Rhodobacterales bacterium HKCCE2091]
MTYHETDTRTSPRVHLVSAFTHDGAGGNPAGVVLDADGLTESGMQAIAARTGRSETAFVSRSDIAAARLDFFTPNRRIAHCGHATIAAFALMKALGRIGDGPTAKETVDGPRRILVRGDLVFMEQRAPRCLDADDLHAAGIVTADMLHALGLGPDQLDPAVTPRIVNTGNRFLLIGLRDRDDLAGIAPDMAAVAAISDALDLVGIYPFVRADRGGVDATARMFGPHYGIPEEAATGMAAGPLACLLHDDLGVAGPRIVIEQGRFMPRPSISRITVDLDLRDGRIAGLMAGGRGRLLRTLPADPIPSARKDAE